MKDIGLALFTDCRAASLAMPGLEGGYSPAQRDAIVDHLNHAMVELAVSAWPGPIWLYTSSDQDESKCAALVGAHVIRRRLQVAGDMTARMAAALRERLAQEPAAGALAGFLPHCPWDVIDDANHLLARGRIVVGATQSGGLWFLGVPRARVELLSALAAGGARPLELIKRKALELDADVDLLATMRTIETDTDLWLAAQQCDDLKRFLAGLDAA